MLAASALLATIAVGGADATPTPSQPAASWGTGTLTAADLHALVSQMTLSEEAGMVHGEGDPPSSAAANASCAASAVGCVGEAGWIPGVARLGIPPLRMTDGPAGIRLRHVETAMPAPVGLAAAFDPGAANRYGRTVGLAGRATDQDVWLGPMINEVNYPTAAGRNFETLGEDPYLASQLAAPEVRGVQSTGMVAELKHFIENDFENGRGSTSVAHSTDIEQPGNAAGTSSFGTALADAVTNGTPTVLATADFPAYPAISASQWKSALDAAVFHILSTMNQAGLLEGTQYGSRFTGTPAPGPPTICVGPSSRDLPLTATVAVDGWR